MKTEPVHPGFETATENIMLVLQVVCFVEQQRCYVSPRSARALLISEQIILSFVGNSSSYMRTKRYQNVKQFDKVIAKIKMPFFDS